MTKLDDLRMAAEMAAGPFLVDPSRVAQGGIDPLGLRQVNFDLMDRIFPGLNNVARHVRPYILMSWAWRRLWQIFDDGSEENERADRLRDFVDRIEAIYVWSQFLREAKGMMKVDLPGRQALGPLLSSERYCFGGEEWIALRNTRRESTGLISPISYGPSLRALDWLPRHDSYAGVYVPDRSLDPVLDRFEAAIEPALSHDAFCVLGEVTVTRADVETWGNLWALDGATPEETEEMRHRLCGPLADPARRRGAELMEAAWRDLAPAEANIAVLRVRMGDHANLWNDPSQRPPTADSWRELQLRQLFRLTLESIFGWIVSRLLGRPQASAALASNFLQEAHPLGDSTLPVTAQEWLLPDSLIENPVLAVERLELALRDPKTLPSAILSSLALCISQAPEKSYAFEPAERLPLARARREALSWLRFGPKDFLIKVFDNWIMAQHTYWSVSRSISDARADDRMILRLRIVMDEYGWTLTPSTTRELVRPAPTGDRLESAFELLRTGS